MLIAGTLLVCGLVNSATPTILTHTMFLAAFVNVAGIIFVVSPTPPWCFFCRPKLQIGVLSNHHKLLIWLR